MAKKTPTSRLKSEPTVPPKQLPPQPSDGQESPDLPYIHGALRPLAVPVDALQFDKENTRLHDERSILAIKDSLEQFGQDQPLVVQSGTMVVRKGNGRLQAAKRLGWTHVACVIMDEDDISATMRSIADNRSAELSQWDPKLLGRAFERAKELRVNYTDKLGFGQEEIDRFKAFSTGFLDNALGGARPDATVRPRGNSTGEVSNEEEGQSSPRPPTSLPENDNVTVVFIMSVDARRGVTEKLNSIKQQQGFETQSEALLFALGLLNRGE